MMQNSTNKPHCETFYAIERRKIENFRALSATEKWRRVTLLMHLAEKRLRADIAKRHPNVSAHEMQMRVASHRIPADLMRKAYNWDPELTDDRYDKEHELEEQLRQAQIRNYEQRKRAQQSAYPVQTFSTERTL